MNSERTLDLVLIGDGETAVLDITNKVEICRLIQVNKFEQFRAMIKELEKFHAGINGAQEIGFAVQQTIIDSINSIDKSLITEDERLFLLYKVPPYIDEYIEHLKVKESWPN